MKKAVIIGISGQDGAYLSQLLLEKNYHVILLANFLDVSVFNLLMSSNSINPTK